MDFPPVKETFEKISLEPWYREGKFKLEYLYDTELCFDHAVSAFDTVPVVRFRIEYYEPDTLTGNLELQEGRWWYIEDNFTEDAIIKTAWLALTLSDEHRRREGFLYDGQRLFNPHAKLVKETINAGR